jgi:hypothetical protein
MSRPNGTFPKRRRGRLSAFWRSALLRETAYSALAASIVTPAQRYLLGFPDLFSGYDFLFAFLTSLLVLD